MPGLKILHISTSNSGGAANAAFRLHESLLAAEVDSKFLCLKLKGKETSKVVSYIRNDNAFEKMLTGLKHKVFKYHKWARVQKQIKKTTRPYSLPITPYRISTHPLVKDADIINLHWVSGFLDWRDFFNGVDKPVVWTLHDMNPFLNGLHYFGPETLEISNFKWMEHQICNYKRKHLALISSLAVVGPSRWIMNESLSSDLFSRFKHYHIPYGINTDVFRPFSQSESKDFFGLSVLKKTVLFIASSIKVERKGFHLLLDALKELNEHDIELLVVGQSEAATVEDKRVHYTGYITEPTLLARAYSSADIFIIPSTNDNLPNTVIESLCCGTPVVGFNTGGIPDMIKHGKNGLLCKPFDGSTLAHTVKEGLKMNFDRDFIRADAVLRFDQKLQVTRYLEAYRELRDTVSKDS